MNHKSYVLSYSETKIEFRQQNDYMNHYSYTDLFKTLL